MSATCSDRAEQRLLFATGGLDEVEREAFRLHMAGCETCTNVVRAAREVLEDEEPALPEEDLSSIEQVRARLMRRVRDGQHTPAVSFPQPRARWLRSALAAGISATLVGGGAWIAHRHAAAPLLASNQALEEQLAVLHEERARLAAGRDELQGLLDGAMRQVNMLRAEDLVVVSLTATEPSSAAAARIFWHAKTFRCYISARGLPPLDADRRYALWVFTSSGETILVGSFDSDAAGDANMYAELPDGTTGIVRVIVTDEPEGIADSPTGSEHLVWLLRV